MVNLKSLHISETVMYAKAESHIMSYPGGMPKREDNNPGPCVIGLLIPFLTTSISGVATRSTTAAE